MMDEHWLRCSQCGKPAFLIRNLCAECGPVLHERHEAWMAFISEASDEFEAKTGKKTLAAYTEFEKYLLEKVEREPDISAKLVELEKQVGNV